jgi:prevent-host-death family protein
VGDVIRNLYDAKTNLSKLVDRASKGEEFIITKNGVPMAKLVPIEQTKGKRKFGVWKGKIWISPDFDDPLPDDILRAFYEGPIEPPA